VVELASIGLDIAHANALNSTNYVSGEADSRRYRSDEGDALDECVRQYGTALAALKSARDDFDNGQYGDAEQNSSAAEDAGARCEQAFTDLQLESLVSDIDKMMHDWTSVASDLIDLLLYVDAKAKRSSRRLLRA
jgi:pectinesterase inhibitor-like protein